MRPTSFPMTNLAVAKATGIPVLPPPTTPTHHQHVIRITGCKQGDCVKHSDGVIFDREGILYAIWNCAVCGENYCAPAGAMSVHINARDWRN